MWPGEKAKKWRRGKNERQIFLPNSMFEKLVSLYIVRWQKAKHRGQSQLFGAAGSPFAYFLLLSPLLLFSLGILCVFRLALDVIITLSVSLSFSASVSVSLSLLSFASSVD